MLANVLEPYPAEALTHNRSAYYSLACLQVRRLLFAHVHDFLRPGGPSGCTGLGLQDSASHNTFKMFDEVQSPVQLPSCHPEYAMATLKQCAPYSSHKGILFSFTTLCDHWPPADVIGSEPISASPRQIIVAVTIGETGLGQELREVCIYLLEHFGH